MEIFTVAIDANGCIVKISPNPSDIQNFIDNSGREDLYAMAFCSISEYYEYIKEHCYSVCIF